MQICIIGAGNIGTQFAAVFSAKGYKVNVFTSKPWLFNGKIEVVDEYDNVIVGEINKATDDIKEAVTGSEVIFVTYPAFKLGQLSNDILPYIESGMQICVVPGTGGAEFSFNKCIKAGAKLMGLQRVPSVARLEEYGKRVRCEGLRSELHLASVDPETAKETSKIMAEVWGIKCTPLPNYLNVTLTPSNPILHTTRLRTLFEDYSYGKFYEKNPLFYGEWSDRSSELLIACDDELQQICNKLNALDLSYVRSLKLHYESDTVEAMTKKISSISSLHNLKSPMIETENGWIPDFKSRYFTADFPFGLALIEQFADVVGIEAKNIRETMKWYRTLTNDRSGLILSDYGIKTIDDIYSLYGTD